MHKILQTLLTLNLLMITIAGCSPPDRQAIQVAQQSMERQAEQNKVMAEQSQKTTEAAGNLVKEQGAARRELAQVQQKMIERDAEGRQDLNRLQQDAQKSSSEALSHVDRERTKLETERREIAQDRYRAPIIAEAVRDVGILLVCLLPLLVAVYVLHSLRSTPAQNDALSELLIQELVTDEPRLLSYQERPTLEPPDRDSPRTALSKPDEPEDRTR